MPKFLITASYTPQGTKGLLTEGGSGRRASLQQAFDSIGGRIEAMYFMYGDDDVMLIADVPDSMSGLALTLAANASGTVRVKTTPLIGIEEMDKACKKSTAYRPAGATGA